MARTPVHVGDELFAQLQNHFTSPQLVELATEFAQANFRSRFNRVFHCQSSGFSDGQFCPLPEK